MKTTRTRILMAVIAASIVVTTFMDWDECEMKRAFVDGYNAGTGKTIDKIPEPLCAPPPVSKAP
jgi:hypothetical protein